MAPLTAVLFLLALALALAAAWALHSSQRVAMRARVAGRFRELSSLRAETVAGAWPLQGGFLERWLWRASIRLTPGRVLAGAAGLVFLVAMAWRLAGLIGAAAALGGILALVLVWPQVQHRRRAAAMVAQVPLFLDQLVRGLATGRNLEGALRLATEETRPPLGEVMTRVQQAVDLGEDVGEALRDAARLWDLQELHFVAMAVRIAHGYGSSPKEMLESAAKLVRHREQAQRELRALTGETRITAWVLSVLPSALALYMAVVNPDYLNSMWHEPNGRAALLAALGLQAAGIVVLWRMVKSV